MNKYYLLIFLLIFISCNEASDKKITEPVNVKKQDSIVKDPAIKTDTATINIHNVSSAPDTTEALLDEHIRLNGKLKPLFSLSDFEKVFGKPDSTQLMSEVGPCTYIFENKDGSKDAGDRYLYKSGSCFENSKQKVAVTEYRFLNGNFITYKGDVWNASTTIEDVRKVFPKAIAKIENTEYPDHEKAQLVQLAVDAHYVYDGLMYVFFRNGKLYSILWWFPC